jgi:colanic acid biosynthesis glycosyl transferase WcaI
MPYQSENDLPYSLSAADVHWLSHKPEFEGLLFPSKFYGIAAELSPNLGDGRGQAAAV